jgi:hypothetical protein
MRFTPPTTGLLTFLIPFGTLAVGLATGAIHTDL